MRVLLPCYKHVQPCNMNVQPCRENVAVMATLWWECTTLIQPCTTLYGDCGYYDEHVLLEFKHVQPCLEIVAIMMNMYHLDSTLYNLVQRLADQILLRQYCDQHVQPCNECIICILWWLQNYTHVFQYLSQQLNIINCSLVVVKFIIRQNKNSCGTIVYYNIIGVGKL